MSKFDNAYLDLCEKILKEGKLHHNRTGDDTLRILGYTFEFDLQDEFPILTTKQVGIKGPVLELLWIYQAQSNDVNWLKERGIKIWNEWEIDADGIYRQDGSNRDFGKEFAGTIGTAYGWITKHFEWPQKNIHDIINHPESRRNIIDLWQADYLKTAVLPPCVYNCQFIVDEDTLNIRVTQRSCDVGLGLPYNITQYATFLCLIAHVTGLKPGKMLYQITDTHIYLKHVSAIKEQISRREDAKPAPKLWINPEIKDFFEFDNSRELKDIKLIGYEHLGKISMEVSI
ncbi:MAG: thymidylate synthase [Clostridia bacterium]|nr:thymidylate synthase [Clostridia bacterium]